MKGKKTVILIAAVLSALLIAGTAYAASVLLSPKEAALNLGDEELISVFSSENAKVINSAVETKGYRITFIGSASGSELKELDGNIAEKDYMVFAVERTDGKALDLDDRTVMFTPVIEDYQPRLVNQYTLCDGEYRFIHNGVMYVLSTYESLEKFADREVSMFAYSPVECELDGEKYLDTVPGDAMFTFDEASGKTDYCAGYDGVRAVFVLPLDSSKADRDAAAQLLREAGYPLNEDGTIDLSE